MIDSLLIHQSRTRKILGVKNKLLKVMSQIKFSI